LELVPIAQDAEQRNTKGNGDVIQIMHKKEAGWVRWSGGQQGDRGLGAAGECPAADEGDDDVDAQLLW
jgi:hypothetical protein